MKWAAVTALAVVFLNVGEARSQGYMSGRDLAVKCASDREWAEGVCAGYVIGAFDAYTHLALATQKDVRLAPLKATIDDVRKTVLVYLLNHEEELDEAASVLILRAVMARYPLEVAKNVQ